jgi:hypothetical protein
MNRTQEKYMSEVAVNQARLLEEAKKPGQTVLKEEYTIQREVPTEDEIPRDMYRDVGLMIYRDSQARRPRNQSDSDLRESLKRISRVYKRFAEWTPTIFDELTRLGIEQQRLMILLMMLENHSKVLRGEMTFEYGKAEMSSTWIADAAANKQNAPAATDLGSGTLVDVSSLLGQ